jgi:hypothetical protein
VIYRQRPATPVFRAIVVKVFTPATKENFRSFQKKSQKKVKKKSKKKKKKKKNFFLFLLPALT